MDDLESVLGASDEGDDLFPEDGPEDPRGKDAPAEDDPEETALDELQEAGGFKIKDREGFKAALRTFVESCMHAKDEDYGGSDAIGDVLGE